ncbi:MAG: bifunctional oligoribonuclease/PAP phosphatase NrnA [Actinomycetota bacterium]|nr:bifunctional oligoribonuclease/PAP phosphatase NrnA [Actinomycetota bacterium]
MRYDLPDWDKVVEALRSAEEVVIACHINPDGDALGSLLGASAGLEQLGKKTYASWGTQPVEVPFAYRFLPSADSVMDPAAVPATDTFLAVDCGAADRLGVLEQKARAASCLINIDHHPANENFGTLNLVDTRASSTAELVTYLLADLGVRLDKNIATCLYTGVVTDTGRFQHSNSTPDTLRLAADLLSYDVSAPQVATEVFDSSPFGYLKLVGRVLDRAELFEQERFVYSYITQKDLAETGVGLDETEKLIDLLRATRAADVAAIFKEQPEGNFRVSLRSRGPSVGAIARRNGGGGHELAAGFTASSVEEALREIRAGLAD